MTKKSTLYLGIFIIFSLLIVGGVLWYANEVKKEAERVQEEMEEQKKQEEKNATPKTFQDLVDQSETITLPTVDTSKWEGYYRNEQLGIEFRYPKEEGWEIKDILEDKVRDGGVCIGNPKFQYVLIEGESECIVGINLFNISSNERNIVSNLNKRFARNIKLPYFSNGVFMVDFQSLYLNNGGKIMAVYFNSHSNINEITNTSYGILQTLKPLPITE